MPCEVVLLSVDFFKMAAVTMEMAKMLKKNKKHKNDHSRLLASSNNKTLNARLLARVITGCQYT
jgi:hypothetical protein